MRVQSREFHKLWLGVTAFCIAFFGPLFTLGAAESTSDPMRFILSILAFKPMSYAELTTRFISAAAGGFLMGWAVTIWLLRCWVYDVAPEAIRKCVLYGAVTWVAFDSTGCFIAGIYSNIAFNIFFLFMAVGPLWVPAEEDKSALLLPSETPLLQQQS